ncbi:MAG: hypothetical protein OXH76_07360 [Boseongicola sp.]|nr:hypothetical protein [Boseongicola sp.]
MTHCTKCEFAIQLETRPKMSGRSPDFDAVTVNKSGRAVRFGTAWRETGLRQPMRWNLPALVHRLSMEVSRANAMLRNRSRPLERQTRRFPSWRPLQHRGACIGRKPIICAKTGLPVRMVVARQTGESAGKHEFRARGGSSR